MIFKIFKWLLMLFLLGGLYSVPAYAEQSSSQSAIVTIPAVNSISVTYSENDSKIVPIFILDNNTNYAGNIHLVNYSNKDVDVWVRSEGINTQTGENIEIHGLKCWNGDTNKNEELNDNYKKMGVLNKPKQGTKSSLPTLDLQLGSLSIIPDKCALIVYVTTMNPDLMIHGY